MLWEWPCKFLVVRIIHVGNFHEKILATKIFQCAVYAYACTQIHYIEIPVTCLSTQLNITSGPFQACQYQLDGADINFKGHSFVSSAVKSSFIGLVLFVT